MKKSALEIYIDELSEITPCDEKENAFLIDRVLKKDEDAKLRLIEGNLHLVPEIVVDYEGLGVPALDLIQEGNIALMNVVSEIADCSIKSPFEDYAIKKIVDAVQGYIEEDAKEKIKEMKMQEANEKKSASKETENPLIDGWM